MRSDPRRGTAAVALLLALLAGAAPATARPAGLSLQAAAGFGGYYQTGSNLPVQVTVENRGADWSGQIRVGPESTRLSVPVDLAAPSKKRISFTLPSVPFIQALEVRLVSGGRTAAVVEAPLRPLSPATPLFVTVSERASTRSAWAEEGPVGRGRLAHVPARDLPEDWHGYPPADGVILGPGAAAELRPAQARALSDWLLLGGRLALSSREPGRLWELLVTGPLPTSAVAAGRTGELGWGRGSILLLDAPVAPRTVAEARDLLAGRLAALFAPPDRSLLRQVPVDEGIEPRPAGPLIAVFLLYWAAVALVFTVGSRPPRSPFWSLGAMVGVAALFTAVVLGGLGRIAHRGRAPLASASLVHVFAGAEEAFLTTRGDLLSVGGGTLRLRALLRDACLDVGGVGGDRTEYRLTPDGRTSVAIDAPLWSRERLWAEGFVPLGLRLEVPPGAPARIVNGSELELRGCRLVARGEIRRLADVRPGESLRLPGPEAARQGAGGGAPLEAKRGQLLEQVASAYRLVTRMGGAEGTVLCSVVEELSVWSGDRPLEQLGGPAVVVFHLPAG